jgi:hypothetical protein
MLILFILMMRISWRLEIQINSTVIQKLMAFSLIGQLLIGAELT